MKLWIIRPVSTEKGTPWAPWYDKLFGAVVCAEDEKEARALCASESGDEGEDAWLNPELSTCVELVPACASGVVIVDFTRA